VTARPGVVLLDYGSGNIHSAAKALEHAGADVTVTSDKQAALRADGLLVPGVGAFRAVVDQLQSVRGGEIVDHRLAGGRPVLGICVGMQVLFERGIERGEDTEGLGQWPGTVEALRAEVVPHMGWNSVDAPSDSVLFDGLHDERFYFVHSYAATSLDIDAHGPFAGPKTTWATHGDRFLAAVENGPLSATQFHPEKSGSAGIALLSNWLRTL
jgi:glutamine amidotransferase